MFLQINHPQESRVFFLICSSFGGASFTFRRERVLLRLTTHRIVLCRFLTSMCSRLLYCKHQAPGFRVPISNARTQPSPSAPPPSGDANSTDDNSFTLYALVLLFVALFAQPNTWSYVQVQWNASHAESYVNSSLCGSTESGYGDTEGTGWGSAITDTDVDLSLASSQSNQASEENEDSSGRSDNLLVGAWRGAPDGIGVHRLGGYFMGLLDNLEVRI